MFTSILLILNSAICLVSCMDFMIGLGVYHVVTFEKCNDTGDDLFLLEVTRRKVNRTHDGFNSVFTMHEDLDSSYGVRVVICKYVDGGCKMYNVMQDDSVEHFIKKYGGDNIHKFLRLGDVNPPDFPMKKGVIEVNNFIFNYGECPKEGLFGVYGCHFTILKEVKGVGEEVVGCLDMVVEFKADDDNFSIL